MNGRTITSDDADLGDLYTALRALGEAREHVEKAVPQAQDWVRHALVGVQSDLQFAERRLRSALAILDGRS